MKARREFGGYVIGNTKVRDLVDFPSAVRARKKPVVIVACKIDQGFEVETTEGLMSGKAGDWLMQGVSGELYICPADIFEKSYDIVDKHIK